MRVRIPFSNLGVFKYEVRHKCGFGRTTGMSVITLFSLISSVVNMLLVVTVLGLLSLNPFS